MTNVEGQGTRGSGRARARRRGAVIVVVALIAGACGGDTSIDTPPVDTEPAASPDRTAEQNTAETSAALGRLDFLGFEGDDALEITARFREETGLEIESSYVNAEVEAEAKILGGAADGVDVVSFTSTASAQFQDSGIVQPLDRSRIPNLELMLPIFDELAPTVFTNSSGELTCVPAYWGAIGVAYDTSVVAAVSAWSDLLSPVWTGRLTTIDFPNPVFYVAAVVNDIDLSRMTDDDLEVLVDWLAPYMRQMRLFSPTFGDITSLLASGEVNAVMPGFAFLVGGATEGGNDDIALEVNLAEGAPILASCQGIASTADNLDAAYAWLNNLLAPEVSAANAELQGGIVTVVPAIDLISAELRARYPYDDLAAYMESSEVVTDWPASSEQYVDSDDVAAAWAELKALAAG